MLFWVEVFSSEKLTIRNRTKRKRQMGFDASSLKSCWNNFLDQLFCALSHLNWKFLIVSVWLVDSFGGDRICFFFKWSQWLWFWLVQYKRWWFKYCLQMQRPVWCVWRQLRSWEPRLAWITERYPQNNNRRARSTTETTRKRRERPSENRREGVTGEQQRTKTQRGSGSRRS